MEKKGGCCGCVAAVGAGFVLGLAALLVIGYFWVNTKVLSTEPVNYPELQWTAKDEAAFTAEMEPAFAALKNNRASEHKISLNPKEANYLVKDSLLQEIPNSDAELTFGDTALVLRFSVPLSKESNKFLNGELKTRVSGSREDFEVEVYGVRTGDYDWPETTHAWMAYWLRGSLETNSFLEGVPVVIESFSHDQKGLDMKISVQKQKGQ
ncbi:MAG: hypothetical protein R6V10_15250 [bacterium]